MGNTKTYYTQVYFSRTIREFYTYRIVGVFYYINKQSLNLVVKLVIIYECVYSYSKLVKSRV